MGLAPNHPFVDGIFPEKTIQLLGIHPFMESKKWMKGKSGRKLFYLNKKNQAKNWASVGLCVLVLGALHERVVST
jgi:hypothetical protein